MNALRYVTSAILLGLLAGMGTASAQATAESPARKVAFNIPEQPLGDALRRFGEQTGLQVVLYSEIGRGLKAPKVSGDLTPRGALDRLLANSGLKYEYLNAQTVAISDGQSKAPSSQLSPAAGAINLAQVDGASRSAMPTVPKDLIEAQEMEVKSRREVVGGNTDRIRTMNDVQPYYIYDSEFIERSGALDVEDFLKMNVTMNTVMMTSDQGQGSDGTAAANSFFYGPSASSVNLNGLGANATLVLIDGRRQGALGNNDGSPSQIDLSTFPTSAIERIEILPSSASAIYGASAMGGVVNVIMKRNYAGGDATVQYDRSENANDPKKTATLSYGWSFGRTQFSSNFSVSADNSLTLGDRVDVFGKALNTILANRPTYFTTGITAHLASLPNIVASTATVTNLTFHPDFGGGSLGGRVTRIPVGLAPGASNAAIRAGLIGQVGQTHFGFADTTQTLGLRRTVAQDNEKHSAQLRVTRQVTPWLDMSAMFQYSVNDTSGPAVLTSIRSTIRPRSSAFVGGTSGPTLANSVNPFTQPISISYPVPGEIDQFATNISRRGNIGAVFALPGRWTASVDANWSRFSSGAYRPSLSTTAITRAMELGEINPFVDTEQFPLSQIIDLAGDPVAIVVRSSRSYGVDMGAQGALMMMPWGAAPRLSLRAGHSINDPGNTTDLFGVSTGRKQTLDAISGEVTMPLVRADAYPLLRGLDLQIALSTNRSSQELNTSTSRTATFEGHPGTVGFMYKPFPSLMIRVSRGTGFTVPILFYLTPSETPPAPADVVDPRTGAPVTVLVTSGGNPNLEPENSKSTNAGIIWQPRGGVLEGLRLNAEYTRTRRENAIATPGAQFFVDNESEYPDRVTRAAGGVLTQVDASAVNLLGRTNASLTFAGEYSIRREADILSLRAQHTRMLEFKTQRSFTLPVYNTVGFPHEEGVVEHKSNVSLQWQRNQFRASWTVNRTGDYKIRGAAGGPRAGANGGTPTTNDLNNFIIPQGGDTVSAQIRHDATLGYSTDSTVPGLLEGVTVTLGVRNIFNAEPPMDVTYTGNFFINPIDRMRMRSFWLSAKKRF